MLGIALAIVTQRWERSSRSHYQADAAHEGDTRWSAVLAIETTVTSIDVANESRWEVVGVIVQRREGLHDVSSVSENQRHLP